MKPPQTRNIPSNDDPGFIHFPGTSTQQIRHWYAPACRACFYLTDTAEDMGGFQCAPPGFHRTAASDCLEMLLRRPRSLLHPDLTRLPEVRTCWLPVLVICDLDAFPVSWQISRISPRLAQHIKMNLRPTMREPGSESPKPERTSSVVQLARW